MDTAPAELTDEQRAALERLGQPETPELLRAVLPYVERERDLALLAAEGSGRELLYALAAAERCDPATAEAQALVLTPARETALRAARAGYELAGPAGLDALAWPTVDPEPGVSPLANLVAGRPDDLLAATSAGRLSLGEVRLVVLDGVDLLESADQWESADALLEAGDDEVQRIAASGRLTDRFREVASRRLRRPRRWPRELFEDGAGGAAESGPALRVASAGTEDGRIDRLGDALREAVEAPAEREREAPPEPAEIFVHCPDRRTAERVASGLAARGFRLSGEPGEPGVAVVWGAEEEPDADVVARFGLPPGVEEARRWLGAASRPVVVVEPRHRRQLELLAARAGWPLQEVGEPVPAAARGEIERLRDHIARRADRVDPVEMLLLEPLFESHGAAAVAAALSGWLREDLPEERLPGGARRAAAEPGGGEPEERRGEARGRPAGRRGRAVGGKEPGAGREPDSAWTRLFIKVGERDDVGPGDLVGAITGESDAVGSQIGKIDIRETYSLVEIEPEIADRVIRDLSGSTIRGREAEVRRDRKQ